MLKDLSEALTEAKKRRGVFSKTIIWESGVSKSQFYRIIRGTEAPSAETKKRISDSLGIDVEQFEALFQKSELEIRPESKNQTPDQSDASKGNKVLIYAGLAVFLSALVFATTSIVRGQNDLPAETTVVLQEDDSMFIKDVTIPDGTAIPVNTVFVKTWRVKNVGTVTWKKRYLKRMTPLSELICSSPSMVPIPETQPGETVDISVTFKTPHLPGSCRTDWKTTDARGNLYFPELHGLFSIVDVVEE